MHFSIMKDAYVNFHIGYQLLHIPFILLSPGDLIIAAKLANSTFIGVAVLSLAHLLSSLKIKYIDFFIFLFMFGSVMFFYRLLMARGITLFLAFFFFQILLLERRKALASGLLSFIAVFTYPGFPMLSALSFFYFLRRPSLYSKPLLSSFAGATLAILFHPAFPRQFNGFVIEFGGRIFHTSAIARTAEWSTYPAESLIGLSLLPLLLYLSLKCLSSRARIIPVEAFAIACLIGLNAAFRYFEYFIPALTVVMAVQFQSITGRAKKWMVTFGCIGIVTYNLIFFLGMVRNLGRDVEPETRAAFAAADWLNQHSPPRNVVLLPWDYFPYFFFRNAEVYYVNGLNPAYSYYYNSAVYSQIEEAYRGNPGMFTEICRQNKIGYVVMPLNKQFVLAGLALGNAPDFALNYRNTHFAIYKYRGHP